MVIPSSNSFALGVMFFVSLASSMTPVFMKQAHGKMKIFRVADMFAAGVLLATALTHLIPEASEITDNAGYLALGGVCIMHLVHKIPTGSDQESNGAYIFVFALTVHCLLEGFALGASIGSPGAFSAIFTAIMLHKGFAGIALGSTLIRGNMNSMHAKISCLIFALATPFSAASAYLYVNNFLGCGSSESAEGILNSISAGVFIYMALVDMLQEHDHGHGHSHSNDRNVTALTNYGSTDTEEDYAGTLEEVDCQIGESNGRNLNLLNRNSLKDIIHNETTHAIIFILAALAMAYVSTLADHDDEAGPNFH